MKTFSKFLTTILILCEISLSAFANKNTGEIAMKLYNQKHYSQSFRMLKKIPLKNLNPDEFYAMGYMYEYGLGIKKDLNSALQFYYGSLYKTSILQSKSVSLNALGTVYAELHNYTAAFQNYESASKLGNSNAQSNLAFFYANGYGTIQNQIKAYAWVSVAIAQGFQNNGSEKESIQLKNYIGFYLNESQIELANNLAKKYYNEYVLHQLPQNN